MKLKPEFEPKKESLFNRLQRKHKEEWGDPIKTMWRVEEWEDNSDNESGYIPNKRIDQSDWFNTKEEAEQFLSKVDKRSGRMHFRYYYRITSKTLYRKHVPAHDVEKWF